MYYPKSQITPNLYTNGNELQVKSTGENYVGYYYKTSSGIYYSGKTPEEKPSVKLILNKNTKNYQSPLLIKDVGDRILSNYPDLTTQPQPIVEYELDPDYAQVAEIDYESKVIKAPVNTKVPPSDQDYKLGSYPRYFIRKVNNPIFKELSKSEYDRYKNKDNSVPFDLYIPFTFPWTLTGKDKKEVARINLNILQLTEDRVKLPGLVSHFKNKLTEYCNLNVETSPQESLGNINIGY